MAVVSSEMYIVTFCSSYGATILSNTRGRLLLTVFQRDPSLCCNIQTPCFYHRPQMLSATTNGGSDFQSINFQSWNISLLRSLLSIEFSFDLKVIKENTELLCKDVFCGYYNNWVP